MLTDNDYTGAAHLLGCGVAAIKAVAEVESGGSGFGQDGRPSILFEPHVFWRELKKRGLDPTKHLLGNGDILYQKWGTRPYPVGQSAKWAQLERAKAIDETAALNSASWGKFQILGNNHAACGFATVQAFVAALQSGEAAHLTAFCALVKSWSIDRYLRSHDWASFAHAYNGAGYKANHYDTKLANAYKKFNA